MCSGVGVGRLEGLGGDLRVVLGQDLDGVAVIEALRDAAHADAGAVDDGLAALDVCVYLDPPIARRRIALGATG